MIKALAKLLGAASTSRVDALSRQVADLSVETVCQQVQDRVAKMTFSEARGYVRARAARVVRKHAVMAIHRTPKARAAWVDAITRAATERIIPLVLRQTGVGMPDLQVTMRAAA